MSSLIQYFLHSLTLKFDHLSCFLSHQALALQHGLLLLCCALWLGEHGRSSQGDMKVGVQAGRT